MKYSLFFSFFAVILLTSFTSTMKTDSQLNNSLIINEKVIESTISDLAQLHKGSNKDLIRKGVTHTASLWRAEDGSEKDFDQFCSKNFLGDEKQKELLFHKLSKYFESVYGHFNKMTLDLRENVDLDNGPLLEIDKIFSGTSISAHLQDDLYKTKIAHITALNFPFYSLTEKEISGKNWSRLQWAYARLGDLFISRVPAEVTQNVAKAEADADIYIAEYNIQMGSLRTEDGKQLFPDKMSLLSHWNLRDEIKANYGNRENGIVKQKMIYNVMQHIIKQDIPYKVINDPLYVWCPYTNTVTVDNKEVKCTPEPNTRYVQILNNFHAQQAVDIYHPEMNSFIQRKFSGEMEIPQEQVEALFDQYLRSPELIKIGQIISTRLGRRLEAFDIWYDGFKARSEYPQEKLNGLTTIKYPTPKAFEADMPIILSKLGWTKERADYLSAKITVDPARGSGHAWGAAMKGEKAHLRTRIAAAGMDYKGYNIAVHEFGHNVEQTISLYDVDHYMLNGVPNTAFTEALAFIFQSRDLMLLGLSSQNSNLKTLNTLDASWSLMEIMGVGMVDMKIWKWMYANPNATPEQLKQAVVKISADVWNTYFKPVFGISDQPILAIYSHMISNPLYLAAYSYGQIIEFQIEDYLKGKQFSNEIDKIYKQGRVIPQIWMQQAVGKRLSIDPILKQLNEVLATYK